MKGILLNSWKRIFSAGFFVFLLFSYFLCGTTWADTGGISGRVTDTNGNGISNVWVSPLNNNTNTWGNGAYTNSDGNYTLTGLDAGSYKILFNGSTASGNYVLVY